MSGWRALRAEDVEAIPWRGTELVWRPLRAALGLRAFGAAAYTAARPGQCIVERHTEAEDGRGQEEVYVVLEEGRAELGDTPGVLVGVALLAAAEGRVDDARSALERAIAGNPLVREAVAGDPELAALLLR